MKRHFVNVKAAGHSVMRSVLYVSTLSVIVVEKESCNAKPKNLWTSISEQKPKRKNRRNVVLQPFKVSMDV